MMILVLNTPIKITKSTFYVL